MAEKLRVGATYADFEDLSLAIKEYEQQNNTQFVTGASKTVEKANARLPPGKQPWPDKFQYSNIVFTCKHYGVTKTTGVGMRPIQRSFKIDCSVKLIVHGERGLDRLLVTAFNSEHTHEISECVFKAYPGQRRLKDIHSKEATAMLEINIPSFRELTGKKITSRDMRNLQRKKGSPDEELANVFDKILERDENAHIQVKLGSDNTIEFIYLQTSEMKRYFEHYPELLVLDTTYKVNSKNMHVSSLMVLDGDGHGRVVAHALICTESRDIYAHFLNAFVESNPMYAPKIEVVLIDKDFKEIAAINESLPGVAIQLCIWHVLCAIRRRLQKEAIDDQRVKEVMKLVWETAYARLQADYEESLATLLTRTNDLADFVQYFRKNWDECRQEWAMWSRENVANFGQTTTNTLESFHQKLKLTLSKKSSLPKCIQVLVSYSLHKVEEDTSKLDLRKISHCYNLKDTSEVAKFLYHNTTEYAAAKMLKKFKRMKDQRKKMTGVEKPNLYEVLQHGKTYTLCVTQEFHCTCTFYKTMHMICKHGFFYLLAKELDFPLAWLETRWSCKPHMAKCDTGDKMADSSKTLPKKVRQGPKNVATSNLKFTTGMCTLREIGGIISLSSNKSYKRQLDLLKTIKQAWEEKKEVDVVVLEDHSDSSSEDHQHGNRTDSESDSDPSHGEKYTSSVINRTTNINNIAEQFETDEYANNTSEISPKKPEVDTKENICSSMNQTSTEDEKHTTAHAGTKMDCNNTNENNYEENLLKTQQLTKDPCKATRDEDRSYRKDLPLNVEQDTNRVQQTVIQDQKRKHSNNAENMPPMVTKHKKFCLSLSKDKKKQSTTQASGNTEKLFIPTQTLETQDNLVSTKNEKKHTKGRLSFKKINSKVIILDSDSKPVTEETVIKTKRDLTDQPPETNAKRKNARMASLNQRQFPKGSQQCNPITASPMYAFLSRATPEHIEQLLSVLESMQGTEMEHTRYNISAYVNHPARSLEIELETNGHSKQIKEAIESVAVLFHNKPRFTGMVAHMFAVVAVHGLINHIGLNDAARTIAPISLNMALSTSTLDWPPILLTKQAAQFRVANCTLRIADLNTAKDDNWLNDLVIEAFLQLLAQQSNTEEKYSVILLLSQAAQMWEKRDFSWTFEKVPLAKFKLLLMPICSGAHWFLLAVHIPSKTVQIMDSIRSVSRREQYFVLWKNFLLRRNKENNELPTTGWHLSQEQSNFQADGDSCGVFVLMNAATLVNGLPTSVMRQVHVHGFRQYVLQVLCKIMVVANEERCDAKVCKLTQKSTKARWVSCDHCLRWIHYVCDKIKVKPREQWYMCNACTA